MAILCTNCTHWIHIKCNGTSVVEYNNLMEENSILSDMEIGKKEWLCNKCKILKTAHISPIGLEDNQEILNIMNVNSMKALENLPNYEIA